MKKAKLKQNPEEVGPKKREYYDASPQEQELLNKMAALESSSGQDTEHPEIKDPNSMHYGESAVGNFGIMPKTLDQIIKVSPRMDTASPELRALGDKPEEEKVEALKQNPDLQDQAALNLLRMIKRNPVTDEQAAYMWQFGHNRVPDQAEIEDSPRIRKFKALQIK